MPEFKEKGLVPEASKEREKLTVHLLIVDDQAVYRKPLSMVLRFKPDRDGFSLLVDEADSLSSALKQIAENDYKIVITDGVFPEEADDYIEGVAPQDFRGNQVIQAAKAKGVKLVIGMSSEPEFFKGADLVFKKPVDIESLKQAIKKTVQEEIKD